MEKVKKQNTKKKKMQKNIQDSLGIRPSVKKKKFPFEFHKLTRIDGLVKLTVFSWNVSNLNPQTIVLFSDDHGKTGHPSQHCNLCYAPECRTVTELVENWLKLKRKPTEHIDVFIEYVMVQCAAVKTEVNKIKFMGSDQRCLVTFAYDTFRKCIGVQEYKKNNCEARYGPNVRFHLVDLRQGIISGVDEFVRTEFINFLENVFGEGSNTEVKRNQTKEEYLSLLEYFIKQTKDLSFVLRNLLAVHDYATFFVPINEEKKTFPPMAKVKDFFTRRKMAPLHNIILRIQFRKGIQSLQERRRILKALLDYFAETVRRVQKQIQNSQVAEKIIEFFKKESKILGFGKTDQIYAGLYGLSRLLPRLHKKAHWKGKRWKAKEEELEDLEKYLGVIIDYFSGWGVLMVDIYTIARMTKGYMKNSSAIVLIAGQEHTDRVYKFFSKELAPLDRNFQLLLKQKHKENTEEEGCIELPNRPM